MTSDNEMLRILTVLSDNSQSRRPESHPVAKSSRHEVRRKSLILLTDTHMKQKILTARHLLHPLLSNKLVEAILVFTVEQLSAFTQPQPALPAQHPALTVKLTQCYPPFAAALESKSQTNCHNRTEIAPDTIEPQSAEKTTSFSENLTSYLPPAPKLCVPTDLWLFAFPKGVHLVSEPDTAQQVAQSIRESMPSDPDTATHTATRVPWSPSPSFHSFIATKQDGSPLYGYCYTAYHPLHSEPDNHHLASSSCAEAAQSLDSSDNTSQPPKSQASTHLPPSNQNSKSGQKIPNQKRTFAPMVLCLVSQHPFHCFFQALLRRVCVPRRGYALYGHSSAPMVKSQWKEAAENEAVYQTQHSNGAVTGNLKTSAFPITSPPESSAVITPFLVASLAALCHIDAPTATQTLTLMSPSDEATSRNARLHPTIPEPARQSGVIEIPAFAVCQQKTIPTPSSPPSPCFSTQESTLGASPWTFTSKSPKKPVKAEAGSSPLLADEKTWDLTPPSLSPFASASPAPATPPPSSPDRRVQSPQLKSPAITPQLLKPQSPVKILGPSVTEARYIAVQKYQEDLSASSPSEVRPQARSYHGGFSAQATYKQDGIALPQGDGTKKTFMSPFLPKKSDEFPLSSSWISPSKKLSKLAVGEGTSMHSDTSESVKKLTTTIYGELCAMDASVDVEDDIIYSFSPAISDTSRTLPIRGFRKKEIRKIQRPQTTEGFLSPGMDASTAWLLASSPSMEEESLIEPYIANKVEAEGSTCQYTFDYAIGPTLHRDESTNGSDIWSERMLDEQPRAIGRIPTQEAAAAAPAFPEEVAALDEIASSLSYHDSATLYSTHTPTPTQTPMLGTPDSNLRLIRRSDVSGFARTEAISSSSSYLAASTSSLDYASSIEHDISLDLPFSSSFPALPALPSPHLPRPSHLTAPLTPPRKEHAQAADSSADSHPTAPQAYVGTKTAPTPSSQLQKHATGAVLEVLWDGFAKSIIDIGDIESLKADGASEEDLELKNESLAVSEGMKTNSEELSMYTPSIWYALTGRKCFLVPSASPPVRDTCLQQTADTDGVRGQPAGNTTTTYTHETDTNESKIQTLITSDTFRDKSQIALSLTLNPAPSHQLAPSFSLLHDLVSPSALALTLAHISAQKSVLVVSAHAGRLTPLCEGLLALMRPFKWLVYANNVMVLILPRNNHS